MNIKETVIAQALSAKKASNELALLSHDKKNDILRAIAESIEINKKEIIFQNEIDATAATEAGLSAALVERLTLKEKHITSMARGIREIIDLQDPVGETIESSKRPNGLLITKIRVPLGVVGIIYESRPNVTIDAIALCLKAGNAVILRGGSEARNSNHTLARIASEAAYKAGLPQGAIQFIDTTDREAIHELLQLNHLVDVVIPRGGTEMIETITKISKIPVIKHGKGLCHTYIDAFANLDMAQAIAFNAKTQRPSVCNAMESLLVHAKIADTFLPAFGKKLSDAGVEIRGCDKTCQALTKANIPVTPASAADWDTEYLDLILSIKIVDSLDDALHHIARYGTGHSEAIITDNRVSAERFLKEVDAAAVFHNASTRFTDGGEFGLGAEIGISTQKLHARGPMGVRELTSYKYIVYGNGQTRE